MLSQEKPLPLNGWKEAELQQCFLGFVFFVHLLVCFVQSIRYSLIMPNQGMRNTLAVESREVLA